MHGIGPISPDSLGGGLVILFTLAAIVGSTYFYGSCTVGLGKEKKSRLRKILSVLNHIFLIIPTTAGVKMFLIYSCIVVSTSS